MNLARLRKKIDKLDERILNLLNGRAKLSLAIGKVKSRQKASVYSPDREREVYHSMTSNNKGPLTNKALKAIYREIMSGSLSLEKPLKITYLGPQFTFTHRAALKKFGSSVEYVACNNITDIFVEVERNRADYGVVPIENSIEGAVNHTLDMLADSSLKICSEVYLGISHNLLSRETDLKRIKRIYSIPQVYGQCRLWLESNMPQVELKEVSSTAKGAEIASKENGAAAIGSIMAAREYGLNVLAKSIEDVSHNTTRFLVVGRAMPRATRDDKTSLMISVKDKVGALHDMLTPFKKNRINLTKIESRPSKKRPWEYYFFVDLEGHHEDPKAKKAIQDLKKECTYVKILGSYPKAG
ncbi:MAG: prephenate dehydratase [Candidatus Omnitrophota bacterium]